MTDELPESQDAEPTEVQEAVADLDMSAPGDDGPGVSLGDGELGGETDGDGGTDMMDRLWSTEPNPPLEQVEPLFSPDKGGVNRISRGVQKAGFDDALPAVADIFIGLAEEYYKLLSGDSDLSALSSGDSDGDAEVVRT